MSLFSREKKVTKSPLGSLLENTMYTILNDAKAKAAAEIQLLGEAKFLQKHLARLDEMTAQIPSPLNDVEYRMMRSGGATNGDVVLYFKVKGTSTILQHLGSTYKLHGSLGTDGPHVVYLHYRDGYYRNAHHLSRLFYEDIDVLRKFLYEVGATLDHYRHEMRVQLTLMMADLKDQISNTDGLVSDLESLGFTRKE